MRSECEAQLGMCVCTLVGLKLAMTSLTAEVVLTLVPKVLVIFNWGPSAGAGDDSASMSIGVADMVVTGCSMRDTGLRAVR